MRFVLCPTHSVLHEARESDILYRNIIKFFIERIVVESNLLPGRPTMVKNPYGQGKVPAFPIALSSIPPYSEYVQATGDDGSKTGNKPIIYEYSYNRIPKKLKFEILPNLSEGSAGIDANGVFVIFKKDWQVDTQKIEDGALSAKDIIVGMPKADEAKKIVVDTISQRELLSHEITHFINVLRTGGVPYPAKGGDAQFDYGSKEYASSTEELQAYYTEGASRLDRILDMPLADIVKKWDMDYVYYLAVRDVKRFIKAFTYVIIERRHPAVWNNADNSAKRRLAKRVYELYSQYVGGQKPGLRQMVKYLAGSKLKPPREIQTVY